MKKNIKIIVWSIGLAIMLLFIVVHMARMSNSVFYLSNEWKLFLRNGIPKNYRTADGWPDYDKYVMELARMISLDPNHVTILHEYIATTTPGQNRDLAIAITYITQENQDLDYLLLTDKMLNRKDSEIADLICHVYSNYKLKQVEGRLIEIIKSDATKPIYSEISAVRAIERCMQRLEGNDDSGDGALVSIRDLLKNDRFDSDQAIVDAIWLLYRYGEFGKLECCNEYRNRISSEDSYSNIVHIQLECCDSDN